jgi:predicted transcriptional regulator of viral defense system
MSKVADAVFRSLIPASPVFTTRDVAGAAHVADDVASRDLSRLASRGLITHVMRGIWADTRHPDFSPYAVVPVLLQTSKRSNNGIGALPGYISLTSALNLRGMIQQIPRSIHVVVASQRPKLRTAVGVYEFHRLDPSLIAGAEPFGTKGAFDVATSAKALFDTLYVSVRRGRRFAALPELEFPRDFRIREMETWIRQVAYAPLREAVHERWNVLCRNRLAVAHSGGE